MTFSEISSPTYIGLIHYGEGRDGLAAWDGNVVKLGCDDGCTTINLIKFIELKKKKSSDYPNPHSCSWKASMGGVGWKKGGE